MEVANHRVEDPFFSICIPQYNRTSFLLEALKVLEQQTFDRFEVCISDDRSTDGREAELIEYLQRSRLSFVYKKTETNQRYDGNLRSSIALARGRYCLLHANDDCLTSSTTLQDLHQELNRHGNPSVLVSNFEEWATGEKNWRVRASRLVGSGPEVAVSHFRDLAFVSGIVMEREKAQSCHTDKWDGSEMYQMYVFARLIASGGRLLELTTSTIRQNLQVPGELVDHITRWEKVDPCPIVERKRPMLLIGRTVADAVAPYLDDRNRHRLNEKIFLQLYMFTYPYWIVQYRKIQSWKYAVGISIGMRPENVFLGVDVGWPRTLRLYLLYLAVCALALTVPVAVFERLRTTLHAVAKSLFAKPSDQKAVPT